MVFIVCCVSSCYSTKNDTKLFNFPRNDTLRDLWIEQTAPHCPELRQLSPQQLIQRKICIKHFQAKFLVNRNRRYNAFPTLFSTDEIFSGIPASDIEIKDPTLEIPTDHNYCKRQLVECPTSVTAKKWKNNEPDLNRPSSSSLNKPRNTDFMEIDKEIEEEMPKNNHPATREPSVTGVHAMYGKVRRARLITSTKVLTPKCRQLYNKCKKIIRARKLFGGNMTKRIKDAAELNETTSFQMLLDKMDFIQRKFIEMQLITGQKKKMARRYTLEEKLLSLALLKQSPKGYSILQKIFVLPTKRTLQRILKQIPITTGINKQLFSTLKAKVQNWSEGKKMCSIVFDEIQLSPHVKFIPSADVIHGFVEKNKKPRFADHALVFMLRGICGSWRQPVAYYFCESTIEAVALKKLLQNLTKEVIVAGLYPLAYICDQGVTNQSALKKLQDDTKEFQLRNNIECDNTILMEGYNISVIYDPPHLLKGIRNNMLSKNLLFKGNVTRWDDILDLYYYDCGVGDIRMLPKLTDEHVVPEKIRKMKVRNCAQVLSARVASILRFTSSFSVREDGTAVSPTVKNTAAAVQFFDKLFDSCNGSRSGRCNGKLRGPVKESSEHVQFWYDSIKVLKDAKFASKSDENTIKIVPTLKNWVTTLQSLIRLTRLILSKEGIKFFYTRNLNQDPLENFFGKIRAYNYRFTNPDVFTFQNSFKSILVTNIISLHSKYANCEEDIGETILELKNLIAPTTVPSDDPNDDNLEYLDQDKDSEIDPSYDTMNKTGGLFKVLREKIRVNARAFTAGYVARCLLKLKKCKDCKKTILSTEILGAHELTTYREWETLKNKNLMYPNTRFIVAFSQLVNLTNNYLEKYCYKKNVIKNLKNIFKQRNSLNWLGCSNHNTLIVDNFINITCKMQIFNWCKTINNILSGAIQKKIKKQKMSPIQKLAYEKYYKNRKIKKN